MRLLHTADWHIGELNGPVIDGQNARLLDTLKCADHLVEKAIELQPDAILIAGDLFDKSKLWADNMLNFIDLAAQRLRKLGMVAPVVLLFGTDNHDNRQAFENLKSMQIPNLYIITEPQWVFIQTESGPIQIAGVPGFDKGYFRTKFPGMDPTEESIMCSKFLGDIINGLGTQIDPNIPSVLMAHYTVVGCELDNGEHVFSQSDVVLPKETITSSPFDLVCLGHIHRAQEVPNCGVPTFYSGPVNGLTFNEEGQNKGFWIHEIITDRPYDNVNSTFIKTPSREFLTLELDEENIETAITYSDGDAVWLFGTQIKDKIIRMHYTCSDDLNKQLNRKALEKALRDAGVFHVAEIKPTKIITALVKQELSENSDPLENLAAWALSEGLGADETTALVELAKPLIVTVSAKMPTGTLSGVFEPKRLEVNNYRSYKHEEFDFQKIFFATVNGKNGIGKSAFFMDAISDCLYEEPRSGETGSWITNNETDGMMTFEFSMGATDWKVVRTRNIKGSGKITLSLQENVNAKWENRSGTTTKQTQEKIIALLGMDCATFRCTALIMQDAYGLFMEADKEKRMEVLANILGLNVYEQLTDLAKAKVTEINRQLTATKAKLADLDEKLKNKPDLEADLKGNEDALSQVAEDIKKKEQELHDAENLVRTLQVKGEKANELDKQIKSLQEEVLGRRNEIEQKRKEVTRAQQMLDSESQIVAKSQEYEKAKENIAILKAKEPKGLELKNDQRKTLNEMTELDNQVRKLNEQITPIEKLLANKTELDSAADEYKVKSAELEKMDELFESDQSLFQKIREAEIKTDRTGEELRRKQIQLGELQQKAAMLANSNCIDPEKAKCAFLADAQKAKEQIPVVEADIKSIEESRKPLVDQIQSLENERKELNYSREFHLNLKQLVSSLRPKAELAGQLEAKIELLNSLKGTMIQTEKHRNDLFEHLEEIDVTSKSLQEELDPLPGMIERLPKLEAWAKAKEELPVARQIVISVKDQISGIENDISTKELTVKKLDEERQNLLIETAKFVEANYNALILKDDLKVLVNRQNELYTAVGAAKAKLEALKTDEEERRRLSSEMGPIASESVRYQTLAKSFGFDGIPFSIRSVVPELSAMANDILGQMTGGKMALEMKTERVQKSNKKEVNALEVLIIDWRGSIPYKDRSGGQKVKAALANAFALADLKARRAGIQLGMMFIDEPSFLDEEGVDAYCDALESLNRKYPNMKVLAISHDPRMKARFPQIIEVMDMGEEGSKVRLTA